MTPGSIVLASGRRVWPCDLTVEDVSIEDVAHGLAHMPRWGGHSARFFAVAQHAFLASVFVDTTSAEDPALVQLFALHHDDSEAFLLDLPAPLKQLADFRSYREIEARAQATCYRAFGLDPRAVPAAVKDIDQRLRVTEQRDLNPKWPDPACESPRVKPLLCRITPWRPALARELFIARHRELLAQLKPSEDDGCQTAIAG